jgi:hypothetical protein
MSARGSIRIPWRTATPVWQLIAVRRIAAVARADAEAPSSRLVFRKPALRDRRRAFGRIFYASRYGDHYGTFLDAFDQHLTLPSVFERKLDLVAFLGSED